MKNYLDVTNIFWSFIRFISNTPLHVLEKTDIYKLTKEFNNTNIYKINTSVLYNVNTYSYDILSECKGDIDNEYLIFDNFTDLINGINQLYNYQSETECEYKKIIQKAVNNIKELINSKETPDLCAMLLSINI